MNCYKARRISRSEICNLVRNLKQKIGMENERYFPILTFTENILPMVFPNFAFEIVPEYEMGSKHGETLPSEHKIKIREDVYLRASRNKGRDRLTVAHEVGHLFLHTHDSISLCRLLGKDKLKAYEDPEWQANAFAGELLAPSYLIKNMNKYEVAEECCVSLAAAAEQLKHV